MLYDTLLMEQQLVAKASGELLKWEIAAIEAEQAARETAFGVACQARLVWLKMHWYVLSVQQAAGRLLFVMGTEIR